METGVENKVSKAEEKEVPEENNNMRFYILCLVSLLFTIYLVIVQYMGNHH